MDGEVTLRAVEDGDLPTIFEDQRDPESIRMAAFPAREERAFYDHWAKIRKEEGTVIRTIEFAGEVAGYISSWGRDGELLLGYWISKRFWGKGVATKAVSHFLREMQSRPLLAFAAKHNVGSIRVLEKCGFVLVGEDKSVAPTGGEEVEEFLYRLD